MDRTRTEFEIALMIGCVVAGLAGLVPAVHDLTLIRASAGVLAALGYNTGLAVGGCVTLLGLINADTRLGTHLEGAGITATGLSLGIYVVHLASLRPLPVVAVVLLSAIAFAALSRAWRITGSLRRPAPGEGP